MNGLRWCPTCGTYNASCNHGWYPETHHVLYVRAPWSSAPTVAQVRPPTHSTGIYIEAPLPRRHPFVVQRPEALWLEGELLAAFQRAMAAPRMRLGRPLKGPRPAPPVPPPRAGREPVERLTAHRYGGARSLSA